MGMDIMDIPISILLPLKLDMKLISLATALSVSNRHIWSEKGQLRLMPSLDITDITDIPISILSPLKLDMKMISLAIALSVLNVHMLSEKGQLNLDIMDIPMDSMDTLIMLDTMP